jgi:precorrin-6B methylase 2
MLRCIRGDTILTIQGKGHIRVAGSAFEIRGSGLRLPKNLKSLWPDPKVYSGVSARKSHVIAHLNGEMIILIMDKLRIGRGAGILDIGACDNTMAEYFHEKGFTKAKGIDIDPEILRSAHGRQMNFRDLDPKEKYRVITACNFVDYLPGGAFCSGTKPSFEIVAQKIRAHLLPKGYFILCDSTPTTSKFISTLEENGFILLPEAGYSAYKALQKIG